LKLNGYVGILAFPFIDAGLASNGRRMDLRRVASTDVFRYRPNTCAARENTPAVQDRVGRSDTQPQRELRAADVRDGFYIARAARLAQKARPPPFFTPLPVCAESRSQASPGGRQPPLL
jgi:hypothetical protein